MSGSVSVEIDHIRTYLGGIDSEELSDETIQQAIDAALIVVGERLEDTDASDELRRQIVIAVAGRRSFLSSPVETRRSALDATTEWSVSEYIEELKARVEELYGLVGKTTGGTSAGFATTTRGAFTGSPHDKE